MNIRSRSGYDYQETGTMNESNKMTECPKCGSNEIDSGWILSAGKIAYKSDKMRYPMEGGNVRSYACVQCGFVESFVSEEYLVKVRMK